jgi:signal transduction histidine kinase
MVLVVGIVTSAVFVIGARGAFQREVAERMARHVTSLVAERFGDPPALAQRLAQLRADLAVDITVRDLQGRVVSVTGAEIPPLTTAEAAEVREGGVAIHARPFWLAAALVRDPHSGAARGTVQASPHPRFAWGSVARPALVVGLVLLVVALATRPLARRIARPLERLTEAARRLGAGELGARAPAAAPPGERRHRGRGGRPVEEIGELTRAFNEMAERVERMVRGEKELLANVSHELRSPLARIRMALELLPRGGDMDRRLHDVERDLAELDRLIEDVLTTARLDATGLPTHLAAVDVTALLFEVAGRARHDPLTEKTAVRVAETPPISLVADESLLRRALWNLVENAAKYGAPPITLEAARAGRHVALSVSDDGPGIPASERPRVLDPFYRVDRARTPSTNAEAPRGVGLGLTLARRIAEVHGGSIEVGPAGSVDGRERGCRVTLLLPFTDPASPDPALGR